MLGGQFDKDFGGLLNDFYSSVSGGGQLSTFWREGHIFFNHGNTTVVCAGNIDAYGVCCLLVVGLAEAENVNHSFFVVFDVALAGTIEGQRVLVFNNSKIAISLTESLDSAEGLARDQALNSIDRVWLGKDDLDLAAYFERHGQVEV